MKIKAFWLARIRFLWVAGFSLFFFLNLDQFGAASGLGPAPKYWSVGFFLATAFLFLKWGRLAALLRKPIVWWAMAYLLMSIVWMGWADNQESARDGLMMVVTTVLYIGMAVIAYPTVESSDRLWGVVLWLTLLLAIASILLEYFVPSAYLFAEAGQGIDGRAAGLYLNPNAAGQTLVLILACLMQRSSPRGNLVATAMAMVGLFLTFSRGGFLGWLILVTFASIMGRLPRWFFIAVLACVVVVLSAGSQIFDLLSVLVSPENRNSLDRLAWMLGQGQLNDYSSGEREYLAGFAWQQYLQAPFLGHGLGYIWVWAAGLGTHNMILRHMVEYGVLGMLILPMFLIFTVRSSSRGADRRWLWMVVFVVLALSAFTHNMLERASFVLPFLALNLMRPSDKRYEETANQSLRRGRGAL